MFALGIEYLTGVVAAAERADRTTPEWPPHPGRVFMALMAAHELGTRDPAEREALRWLEALPIPPAIRASAAFVRCGWDRADVLEPLEIWSSRDYVGPPPAKSYVPANDRADPDKGSPLQSVPGLTRKRAERFFPVVRPHDDRVFLIWGAVECPPEHREPLARLCAAVTRIGHSGTLVRMWVADDAGAPTWIPDDHGPIKFRVPWPGYLDRLNREFERNPARLNDVARWAGYARVDHVPGVRRTLTSWEPELIVLRMEPLEAPYRHLHAAATLAVTGKLRDALMSVIGNPVPELVSGHRADGTPSSGPHLAFLALPWVGHEHADGLIRGVAVAIPRATDRESRRLVYRALGRIRELKLGTLGKWSLEPAAGDELPYTLQSFPWAGGRDGATRWASVTPVAFDRHSKARDDEALQEVAGIVRESCRYAGLPEPLGVRLSPISAHLGASPAWEFPRLRRKDGSERRQLHVELAFAEPVQGPLLLGAGRFRGYGLLRPLPTDELRAAGGDAG